MATEGETRPLLAATSPDDEENGGTAQAEPTSSTGNDETSARGGPSFSKNLGTAEAFAIVISIVIGSGIFTSPGSVDTNVPSPGAALVVWLVGGVLAWTGASTMAELGTAIPGEGGVQPYLHYMFGEVFGFLAAWTWIVAVMPATLAILSIVLVDMAYVFVRPKIGDGPESIAHKLFSVLVLVVVGVTNSVSTRATTRLNGFFVATKFAMIAVVVAAGIVVIVQTTYEGRENVGGGDWSTKPWFRNRPTLNPDRSITDWEGMGTWELLGHYSAALYGALWAYSGWDKAIYISAELSAPARQLPLAINTAVPVIILCFITANAAYYILLPWDEVSNTDSVAVRAVGLLLRQEFGSDDSLNGVVTVVMGFFVLYTLVGFVVIGSLLGNSFVASRMTIAAARRGWIPRVFARLGRPSIKAEDPNEEDRSGSSSDAPINALALSTLLAVPYILLGNFRALITFNGLGEYSFFLLTVVGAVVLRFREPDLRRPYKPYLLIPVVFACVSGFVVVRGAVFAPGLAGVLVGLWALGGLVYWRQKGGVLRRERTE